MVVLCLVTSALFTSAQPVPARTHARRCDRCERRCPPAIPSDGRAREGSDLSRFAARRGLRRPAAPAGSAAEAGERSTALCVHAVRQCRARGAAAAGSQRIPQSRLLPQRPPRSPQQPYPQPGLPPPEGKA